MTFERGMEDPRIASIQLFLHLVGDGIYGTKTETAVKKYQETNDLPVTGIVDDETLAFMESHGLDLAGGSKVITSTYFPPKPSFLSPSSNDRKKMFGNFAYKRKNATDIIITDGWDKDNIVKVKIPQLIGVLGAPKDGVILFNKHGVEQIKGFFAEIERRGLLNRVISWAGSYYPRFIRGSQTQLSNHSYGSAFDINAPENWLNQKPAAVGKKGSLLELVPIANSFGFFWGGHYKDRLDGMHFELAKLNMVPTHSVDERAAPSVESTENGVGDGGTRIPATPTPISPEIPIVAVPTEVVPVTQTKPAEDVPQEKDFAEKVRSWMGALPAGAAAVLAAVWAAIKEVKVELVIALIVAAVIIVLVWVYGKQKAQREKAQQDFELKKLRESQAHAITEKKIDLAGDKDKNNVEILPNPITNSDPTGNPES